MIGRMGMNQGGVIPAFTLGDRLRKAREVTGMTQGQLAQRIGVARNTVTRSEVGATEPTRLVLRAWSEVTGVPLQWILTGDAPGDLGGSPGADPEHEQLRLFPLLRAG